MTQSWSIGARLLWRAWKKGELNILLCSLIIAIATVTCISLFNSRIHNAIFDEASHFLAADVKITGSLPPPKEWQKFATNAGLKQSHITHFRAMAFAGDAMTLAQVKAVGENYPLKGALQLSDTPYGNSYVHTNIPKRGEVWISPRLFNALNVSPGDNIDIGEASFVVSAAVAKEPDSGQSIFGTAPRVMMNLLDVDKTNTVQLGSRIRYEWLLAGNDPKLKQLQDWITPQLGEHARWIGVKEGSTTITGAITRAESFLLLTGSLSVILSGVAIALSARRYAKQQFQQVAVLKTFGCKPSYISRIYVCNLLMMGFLCIVIGAALGWLLHWGILISLADLIPAQLPPPDFSSYTHGAITGFIALMAFAAPPILSLRNTPPATVLRNNNDESTSLLKHSVFGLIAIVSLIFIFTSNLLLTVYVTVGATLCIIGVSVLSWGLINSTQSFSQRVHYSWRLGFANLKRHQKFNNLQLVTFSLLFMLLFILVSVRTSLLNQWQEQLPEDAPNHFLFNIFPDEINTIEAFFVKHNISHTPFYPMTRGRLIQVNGEDVKPLAEKAKNRVNYERELNLTWSDTLGQDNELLSGDWWDALGENDKLLVSAESTYAKGLDVTLGDQLTFSVAGIEIEAEVASIRSVKWDSMNPNFYMIFDKPLLNGTSANWITSFFLPAENKPLLNSLLKSQPTTSLIEIDQTIDQVRSIMSKVSLAIEFILMLVLTSGIIVLITSVQATLDLRVQEGAIYRTLGAKKSLVRKTVLVEFICLGALSGILAVVGSEACLFLLQTSIFNLDYVGQYWLWPTVPTLGGILVGIIGWRSARKVVDVTPLTLLRAV